MTPALLAAMMGGGRFNPEAYFGADLVGWWDASDTTGSVVLSGLDVLEWNSMVGDIPGVGSVGGGTYLPHVTTDQTPRQIGFNNGARVVIGSVSGKLPTGNAPSFIAAAAFPSGGNGAVIGWGASPNNTRSLTPIVTNPGMSVNNGGQTTVRDNSKTWSGSQKVVTGEVSSGDPSVCKMTTDGQLIPYTANVSPGVATSDDSAGIGYDSTTNQFIGRISEILVVNRTVTTVERQKVEGYLAWKWHTEVQLPVGHPWRNRRP